MTEVPMSLLEALEQRFEGLVRREVESKAFAAHHSMMDFGASPEDADAMADKLRPEWEAATRRVLMSEAVRRLLPRIEDGIPPSHT